MPQPRKYSQANKPSVFVGRQRYRRLLEDAVFAIPATGVRLKVFHGVGGQGKTALRRYFEQALQADSSFQFVKTAVVDLHKETLADPVSMMVWIRNGFARAGLSLPVFDVAFAVYWQEKYGDRPLPGLIKPLLARSGESVTTIASESASFLMELTEQAVSTLPGLGLLISKTSRWVFDKQREPLLALKFPELRRLYEDGRLRSTAAIEEDLCYYLAVDLNQHRANAEHWRYLLIFDEYEKLFPNGGSGERWKNNDYDHYVRQFISEVDGLLAVFFSREPLPWSQHPDWVDDVNGHQHSMSSLTHEEAQQWLLASGVADQSLQAAIIDAASITEPSVMTESLVPGEAPGGIYPLLLSLLIEHYQMLVDEGSQPSAEDFAFADSRFEGRRLAIIHRVLHHFDTNFEYLLERLCLVNGVDRETFTFMVDTFGIAISLDYFDRLTAISVFSEDESGIVYLHSAVAEAIAQSLPQQKRQQTYDALFLHFDERRRRADTEDDINAWAYAFSKAAHYLMYQEAGKIITWFDQLDDNTMLEEDLNPLMLNTMKRCVDHLERQPPADSRVLLKVQYYLAKAHAAIFQYENTITAINISEQVVAAYEHNDNTTSVDALLAHCLLGSSLLSAGDTDRGKTLLDHVWAQFAFLSRQGLDGLDCLTDCALGLACFFEGQDQILEAVAVYDQLLAEDWSHLPLRYRLSNISWAAFYQSKCGRQDLLEELKTKIETLFNQSPDSWQGRHANAYVLYAMSCSHLRDHQRALWAIEMAEAIVMQRYGRQHELTLITLNQKAKTLYAAGRIDDGNRITEEVYELQRDVLGRSHPDTAQTLTVLANIYVNKGRFDLASQAITEALAIFEANSEPLEWQRRDCEYWAAHIYTQTNHPQVSVYINRLRAKSATDDAGVSPRDVQQLLLAAKYERSLNGSQAQFYQDLQHAYDLFLQLPEDQKNTVQRELAELCAAELVRHGLHNESTWLIRIAGLHDLHTHHLLKPERIGYYDSMAEQQEWHGNYDRAITYVQSALALCRYNPSLFKTTAPLLEIRKLSCLYFKAPSPKRLQHIIEHTDQLLTSTHISPASLRPALDDVADLLCVAGHFQKALVLEQHINTSWEAEGLYPIYQASLNISMANRLFDNGDLDRPQVLYQQFFDDYITQAFQPAPYRCLLRWLRYWRLLAAAGKPNAATVLQDQDLALRGPQASHTAENCTIALILVERAIALTQWDEANRLLREVESYHNSGKIHSASITWLWSRYLTQEVKQHRKQPPYPLCEMVAIARRIDSSVLV